MRPAAFGPAGGLNAPRAAALLGRRVMFEPSGVFRAAPMERCFQRLSIRPSRAISHSPGEPGFNAASNLIGPNRSIPSLATASIGGAWAGPLRRFFGDSRCLRPSTPGVAAFNPGMQSRDDVSRQGRGYALVDRSAEPGPALAGAPEYEHSGGNIESECLGCESGGREDSRFSRRMPCAGDTPLQLATCILNLVSVSTRSDRARRRRGSCR